MTKTKKSTIQKAVETALENLENGAEGLGICLNCGAISDEYVEPDAEEYECADCGCSKVYGLEQILVIYAI